MRTNKIIFILAFLVVGCSKQTEEAAEYAPEQTQHAEQMGPYEQRDERVADDLDEEVLIVNQQTFMGRNCTVDCSGHEAGYQWAEENSIDDPNDCDGNSNSFNEGCQSYVEEQQ